jgi:hypothetical protein
MWNKIRTLLYFLLFFAKAGIPMEDLLDWLYSIALFKVVLVIAGIQRGKVR